MVFVVADSGSTKTDWHFIDSNKNDIVKVRTIGFNPYFHSSEEISNELNDKFRSVQFNLELVEKVYFYGAGCSNHEKCQIVKDGLSQVFTSSDIEVNHDLLGSCIATLGDKPGIACILGTGSNSCVWDGNKIIADIPSHGYILGDEGSGAYLGRELLKLHFNTELPSSLVDDFSNEFSMSDDEIIKSLYQGSSPNVFLASFAKFYGNHKTNSTLKKIIYGGVCDFFYRRIVKYDNFKSYPLGFVGSIAFHFKDTLEKVADIHGMSIAKVTKCPIEGIVEYHLNKLKVKI